MKIQSCMLPPNLVTSRSRMMVTTLDQQLVLRNQLSAYDGDAAGTIKKHRFLTAVRRQSPRPASPEVASMPQGDRSSAAAGRPGTAPGDLEQVRALVNSSDLEEGTDGGASAAGLASWLERHGLAPAGGAAVVSRTELEQAA